MLSTKDIREIQELISMTLFFGIPLGSTLNDTLLTHFWNGRGEWNWKTLLLNKIRITQHWLYHCQSKKLSFVLPHDHILAAWLSGTSRINGIMQPIIQSLKGDACVVLYGTSNVIPFIPDGVPFIAEDQLWNYSVKEWRAEYRKCRFQWAVQLKSLCRKYEFPVGAFEHLELLLMIASQNIAGSISYLKKNRPAIVLTDADRSFKWSCLVLAARKLGIPTVTLVHGGIDKEATWFSPVLADKIICWGKLDRNKLIAAGERSEKILIGGCPRFSRDLPVVANNNLMKLSLNREIPVVMYATHIERQNFDLVESFCKAVENLDFLLGIVRLHPSENIVNYRAIIEKHPGVKFFENQAATIDESIALVDVVVVHGTTVGSEALLKRVPVVVFDFDADPSELAIDFVNIAGCPHARTPDALADILRKILLNDSYRQKLQMAAENYVNDFCSTYGEESARLTASFIRHAANN